MPIVQSITPCLWFDDRAEEAAEFYVGIFEDARIVSITRYPDAGKEIHRKDAGSVLTVEFELNGQPFTALNGGPNFKFTEAISLQVMCESQESIDYYWEKLSEGGDPAAQQCGWVKDKFGLSWQISPTMLIDLFANGTPEQTGKVMNAMLPMKKLDIEALRQAAL